MADWCRFNSVGTCFIDPGSPWQNAWIESFNGSENEVVEMRSPVMGAEDWSYVLQVVPGAMVFLGTCPPEVPLADAAPNRSNRMVIDEDAMAAGIALHAAVTLDELQPA